MYVFKNLLNVFYIIINLITSTILLILVHDKRKEYEQSRLKMFDALPDIILKKENHAVTLNDSLIQTQSLEKIVEHLVEQVKSDKFSVAISC